VLAYLNHKSNDDDNNTNNNYDPFVVYQYAFYNDQYAYHHSTLVSFFVNSVIMTGLLTF